jgi:phage-related holin
MVRKRMFVFTYAMSFLSLSALELVKKYIFSDIEFAAILGLLVIIDTITGMLAAYKEGVFSSSKMGKVLIKIIVLGLSLSTIHAVNKAINHRGVEEGIGIVVMYFDSFLYTFIVLREAASINENCSRLGYPLVPNRIKRILERYLKK